MDSSSTHTSERYEFRCTNCNEKIPWPISKSDLGIVVWEEPENKRLYPYDKCWCGWGKFVRCEDRESALDIERKNDTGAIIKSKIDNATYERQLPISDIQPNSKQPRKFFDKVALQSLAESISSVGILEDILVRPDRTEGGYEIVLGERRWRASQLARLSTISAKVVDLTEEEVKLISLVENVQREDLTEVEEAFSFKNFIDEGFSVEDVGQVLGNMDERVAKRLKALSSHYYIQFQEDKICSLVADNDRLKQELASTKLEKNDGHTVAAVVRREELLEYLNSEYQFVANLPEDEYLVEKTVCE